MKKAINFSDFVQAFRDYGREDQFSYDALKALFDYYEEREAGTGEDIELDVIAICCDWCEYTLGEVKVEFEEAAGCESIEEATEALAGLGIVLTVDGDPETLLLAQ